MARLRRTDAPDTTKAHDLTAGVIERLTCPKGKQQAFLRDSKAPGLRVRVTAAGAKSFVFEAKLNRQTIRRTIGDVRAWSIEQARAEANRPEQGITDRPSAPPAPQNSAAVPPMSPPPASSAAFVPPPASGGALPESAVQR